MSQLLEDLVEAWRIHDEIVRYVLSAIPEEGLGAVTLLKTGKPSRGRNVARIFAHMHEVRCSKLERQARGAEGIRRFAGSEVPSREALDEALSASAARVEEVVRSAVEEGRPLRGWKRPPVVWIAYLISHESHHRGQIAQALKQSGFRPSDDVSYGVWGTWGGYDLPRRTAR